MHPHVGSRADGSFAPCGHHSRRRFCPVMLPCSKSSLAGLFRDPSAPCIAWVVSTCIHIPKHFPTIHDRQATPRRVHHHSALTMENSATSPKGISPHRRRRRNLQKVITNTLRKTSASWLPFDSQLQTGNIWLSPSSVKSTTERDSSPLGSVRKKCPFHVSHTATKIPLEQRTGRFLLRKRSTCRTPEHST